MLANITRYIFIQKKVKNKIDQLLPTAGMQHKKTIFINKKKKCLKIVENKNIMLVR